MHPSSAFSLRRPLASVLHLTLALLAGTTCLEAAPFATGKAKFVGSAYESSGTIAVNFQAYWNQVTPENSGKWGSVEATRDVMNWTALDAAYAFAKANNFPFKFHTLVWGNQQPAWIESLPAAEQRQEIEEWFAAVAARYPDIDLIDVVNEPINDPPTIPGNGNYAAALGGAGATGWDWVITSFQLARAYFPRSVLLINEYSVTNTPSRATAYAQIVRLLNDRGLVDGVGIQAHAFSTRGISATATRAGIDTIAAPGVPVYISELDIDGATDQVQLDEYKRIFPVFYEHPAVVGMTLWGYRPGLWRTNERAFLIDENGNERPALLWLRDYLAAFPSTGPRILLEPSPVFALRGSPATFQVRAVEAAAYQWSRNGAPIPGANAASYTIPMVQGTDDGEYQVTVTGPGGTTTSRSVTLTSADVGPGRLVNISTRSYVGQGDDLLIAGFVIRGSGPRQVLVRASGSALGAAPFNLTGTLADPVLQVTTGAGVVMGGNDDWDSDPAARARMREAFAAAGAMPWVAGSKEAAVLLTLEPGGYTPQVTGKNGGTGIALVEVFEFAGASAAKLINISTRSLVRTGAELQIAGFVVGGSGPKRVLLRASGPSLAAAFDGLKGRVLADPVLDVYAGSQRIGGNDDWDADAGARAEIEAASKSVSAPAWATGSREAAVILTLNPGAYTAHVTGKNNTTGIALIEVFELE